LAAPEVPAVFPPYLVAGATWQWDQRLYDQASGDEFLPDDGGTVTMRLLGHHSLEFTATANTTDDVWEWRVASSTTDDIPVTKGNQKYTWEIQGSLAGVVYDLGRGSIFVYANPDITAGDDRRSHAQKMVALIEAELEARVLGTGTGHNSYQIHGRSMEKFTLTELRSLRAEYLSAAQPGGRPKPIKTYYRIPSP
jgi:hypothetical protein